MLMCDFCYKKCRFFYTCAELTIMGGVLRWESAAAQHREHLAAFSMGVQSTVWVYSLQHGCTAFSMGVQPAEWLYSVQSRCTACGMGVQSEEWVYSLQHGCTTRSMGVQPAVWLYSLRHSLQPVACVYSPQYGCTTRSEHHPIQARKTGNAATSQPAKAVASW